MRFRANPAGRFLLEYFESGASHYAAGLAFNAFLTMFPLILGLLSVLSFVVSGQQAQQALLNAFPPAARLEILRTIRGLSAHAGTLGVVSLVGLVWSGTNLFVSLEFSLNRIFGLSGRDPLRQRLQGLQMILVFMVATLIAVLVNAAIGEVPAWLGFLVGWVVLTWLLFWIYRHAPSLRYPARVLLPGAMLAGLGIEVLSLVFPLYTHLTQQVTTYTRGFALVFVLLAWVYFLAQLILLGAVFNRSQMTLRDLVPELDHPAVVALPKDAERGSVKA